MAAKTPGYFLCAFSLLSLFLPAAKAQIYSLGTTNVLEGPAAGSDSVILAVTPANAAWTTDTNAGWLQWSAVHQSGTGSANVVFTFAANAGATRTGTLTLAGQTLAVTQAGATYAAITNVTALVSSGLNQPDGVAVDRAGNVYIADTFNNAIKEWLVTSNTVTTLVSTGLNQPFGVAVDADGNVYFSDLGHNAIKEWSPASNTVTSLVSSGLFSPDGVALDDAGNIYIADTFHSLIKQWTMTSNTLTTLVSSNLYRPGGVAVDHAGNVYIANTFTNAIQEWSPASNTLTTLVSAGLNYPYGVAVDGGGNVFIAGGAENVVKKWSAASSTVSTQAWTGLSYPQAVAVDSAGNLYLADSFFDSSFTNAIKELPHAFVDPRTRVENGLAGSDALPGVLPATANLTGPFVPASDSEWLTITGVTNGVVSFAFTANTTGASRPAHITLLGQAILVIQAPATPPFLTGFTILGNGSFQFGFTNHPGAAFTVLATTNLRLPLTNWTVLGAPTNDGAGQCWFTDPTVAQGGPRFYRVRSP